MHTGNVCRCMRESARRIEFIGLVHLLLIAKTSRMPLMTSLWYLTTWNAWCECIPYWNFIVYSRARGVCVCVSAYARSLIHSGVCVCACVILSLIHSVVARLCVHIFVQNICKRLFSIWLKIKLNYNIKQSFRSISGWLYRFLSLSLSVSPY